MSEYWEKNGMFLKFNTKRLGQNPSKWVYQSTWLKLLRFKKYHFGFDLRGFAVAYKSSQIRLDAKNSSIEIINRLITKWERVGRVYHILWIIDSLDIGRRSALKVHINTGNISLKFIYSIVISGSARVSWRLWLPFYEAKSLIH